MIDNRSGGSVSIIIYNNHFKRFTRITLSSKAFEQAKQKFRTPKCTNADTDRRDVRHH